MVQDFFLPCDRSLNDCKSERNVDNNSVDLTNIERGEKKEDNLLGPSV